MKSTASRVSVVTPTLKRAEEVRGLLQNLSEQTYLPYEVILVDGAESSVKETEQIVKSLEDSIPFLCRYIRHGGGTALQRNVGIEQAQGDYIAFVDDDIRLEPDFLAVILSIFAEDEACGVGGITGYITNQYLNAATSPRWQWKRRFNLYTTYEPGRYDFQTGYPINRYLQPPYTGTRDIDFMGAGCAVWRRAVFVSGLRFAQFFTGHGVLEDAHFALRAGKNWRLLECGDARCVHLHSTQSRENHRQTARKTAVNYRYVFVDIVPQRTWKQEARFWRVQFFDLLQYLVVAFRSFNRGNWLTVLGKIEGIWEAFRVSPAK